MWIFIETERLILRELIPEDDTGMFELDSDPEVHHYLGKNPLKTIDQSRQVIEFVRRQYVEYGIGRWAVIEKSTGHFTGWCGLKLINDSIYNEHIDFYDLGYRFCKRFWGKGYATESASAVLNYGFHSLKLKTIYGMAEKENIGSNKVLQKVGLEFINDFDNHGTLFSWYQKINPL